MRLLRRRARAAAAVAEVAPTAAQTPGQFREIKALAFDAYGTLFDVFSVTELCEQLFPGKGNQLAQTWRFKQVQYSLMRSLMGRYRDFWGLTEDGLVWASKNLQLDLTADKKKQLLEPLAKLTACEGRAAFRTCGGCARAVEGGHLHSAGGVPAIFDALLPYCRQ